MPVFISKVSHRGFDSDQFFDRPAFPLFGAALGFIAVLNVTSAMMMLLAV